MRNAKKILGILLALVALTLIMSITAFAEETSKSRVTVTNKLSGETDFSRDDMVEWGGLLGIAPEEYGVYFFED